MPTLLQQVFSMPLSPQHYPFFKASGWKWHCQDEMRALIGCFLSQSVHRLTPLFFTSLTVPTAKPQALWYGAHVLSRASLRISRMQSVTHCWDAVEHTRSETRSRSPLCFAEWQSFKSSQVRAGCFLEPSGLRMVSIWLLRDLRVAWTPGSVLFLSSGAASSSVNSGRGSGMLSS